ncbi:hypothetical protein IKF15_02760 [Candidatus Saccharibacteria bacterium]|nr:hypothetical protein [Candidatus Saccharibacteria bacterium]
MNYYNFTETEKRCIVRDFTEQEKAILKRIFAKKKYVIITDLCCELSATERRELGIWPEFLSASATNDSVDIDILGNDTVDERVMDNIYARMLIKKRDTTHPLYTQRLVPGHVMTHSHNTFIARQIFERAVELTDESTTIVYAAVSPGITSGTVNAGWSALQELKEDYPNRKFAFIDTTCISGGLAMAVKYLANYDGDDITAYGHEIGTHIRHLFCISDFKWAKYSGRYDEDASSPYSYIKGEETLERDIVWANLNARKRAEKNMTTWDQIKQSAKRIGIAVAEKTLRTIDYRAYMEYPSEKFDDNARGGQIRTLGIKPTKAICHSFVEEYLKNRLDPEACTCDLDRTVYLGYASKTLLEHVDYVKSLLVKNGIDERLIEYRRINAFHGVHAGPNCFCIIFRQRRPR